jgi:tight adherence protein B
MYGPLLFGLLVALAVVIGFAAGWRILRSRDPVEARLQEFGVSEEELQSADDDPYAIGRRRAWPGVTRLLAGFGMGPRLATLLARADVPLTAAEFALIMVGIGLVGFVIGTVRVGPLLGLAAGAICGFVPYLYLNVRRNRRQRAFTEQVPDVLTLLVGGLRAGYGLTQALEMLVDNLPPPSSTEFARVMRAVELGLPVQQALSEMADRIGTDDIALVVTAINAQYEMGGNLAQTLETIGETVRARIHLLREIRVLTAQQRFTGYVLAVWPFILGVAIFLLNPDYMSRLFEPDMLWLPAAAFVMMLLGFLVIRRIVDIEV